MTDSSLEIKDPNYRVWYEPKSHTVYFEGKLRLQPGAYRDIEVLLQKVMDLEQERIRLHLHDLQYLNSSGLNMLFKFVVALRKKGSINLAVRASKAIFWHSKAIANIERFFPSAELELA
ncbi:MAG: hypothetical protein MJE77_40980 [Proteobacteria bacterium]|nr:hypothetical protein [Pseudomonadota bacterium]